MITITSFVKQGVYQFTPSYDVICEYKSSKTTTRVVYAEVDYLSKDRIGVRVDRFEINRVDYYIHAWYTRAESGWQVEPHSTMWRSDSYATSTKREYVEKAESVLLGLVQEVAEKYSEPLKEAELIQADSAYKAAVKAFETAQVALNDAEGEAQRAFERYNTALSNSLGAGK